MRIIDPDDGFAAQRPGAARLLGASGEHDVDPGPAHDVRRLRRRLREWRATVLAPDAPIIRASSVWRHPHADGGQARVHVVRHRAEIGLIAPTTETVRAAAGLMLAVGRLSEARAAHGAGKVPEHFIQARRDAEREFNRVARAELRSPEIDLETPTGLPGPPVR